MKMNLKPNWGKPPEGFLELGDYLLEPGAVDTQCRDLASRFARLHEQPITGSFNESEAEPPVVGNRPE